jgi:hypothetical protein
MIDDRTKLDMIRSIIRAKVTWLDSFSTGRNRRPEHEIDGRRHEVTVLRTIAEDYEEKLR